MINSLKPDSVLSIYCQTTCLCGIPFQVRIYSECGKIVAHGTTDTGNRVQFRLPQGRYFLRVRNICGLNPGGFSKLIRVECGKRYCVSFVFSRPLNLPIAVPVNFTALDSNYPGIIDLNGGITVWR